jgi:hypothetical protein
MTPCNLVARYYVSEKHATSIFRVLQSNSTPKGAAAYSSKTVVTTDMASWCHNPEDHNLNHHHHENLTHIHITRPTLSLDIDSINK